MKSENAYHWIWCIVFLAHHPRDPSSHFHSHFCSPIHIVLTSSSLQLTLCPIFILNLKQQTHGESPFDRLKDDDIDFNAAGENLAYGQQNSIFAHEGLMNSLGHRKNILNTNFSTLGVGVDFNDKRQPYWTENYTG